MGPFFFFFYWGRLGKPFPFPFFPRGQANLAIISLAAQELLAMKLVSLVQGTGEDGEKISSRKNLVPWAATVLVGSAADRKQPDESIQDAVEDPDRGTTHVLAEVNAIKERLSDSGGAIH
jgi:hypothetical protein